MLDYGDANINAVDNNKSTPLILATKYANDIELIELLIDKGAEIHGSSLRNVILNEG